MKKLALVGSVLVMAGCSKATDPLAECKKLEAENIVTGCEPRVPTGAVWATITAGARFRDPANKEATTLIAAYKEKTEYEKVREVERALGGMVGTFANDEKKLLVHFDDETTDGTAQKVIKSLGLTALSGWKGKDGPAPVKVAQQDKAAGKPSEVPSAPSKTASQDAGKIVWVRIHRGGVNPSDSARLPELTAAT